MPVALEKPNDRGDLAGNEVVAEDEWLVQVKMKLCNGSGTYMYHKVMDELAVKQGCILSIGAEPLTSFIQQMTHYQQTELPWEVDDGDLVPYVARLGNTSEKFKR